MVRNRVMWSSREEWPTIDGDATTATRVLTSTRLQPSTVTLTHYRDPPDTLRAALAVEHFRRERGVLAEIDEVGRHRILRREPFQIREDLLQTRELDAAEECGGRLPVGVLAGVERQQPLQRLGPTPGRDLRGEPGEPCTIAARITPDHHEVLGNGASGDLADAALEANAGHVVL